jgi:hypothetical protein
VNIGEGLRRLLGRGDHRRVEDSVFLSLRRIRARAPARDYWEGKARLGNFGEIEVFVDIGGDTPSEEQREFFRSLDGSIGKQSAEVLELARKSRGSNVSGTLRPVWVSIPTHPLSEQVEVGFEAGPAGDPRIVGQYAGTRLVAVRMES